MDTTYIILISSTAMILLSCFGCFAAMKADLRNYIPADSSDSVTRSWDEAQSQLQCCGFLTEQVNAPWQMWRYNKALNPMPPDSR